jgi:hypothetical protein
VHATKKTEPILMDLRNRLKRALLNRQAIFAGPSAVKAYIKAALDICGIAG